LEEEKHKSRYEQLLRQAAAVKLDHEGNQVIATLCHCNQGRNCRRRMDNVSVAQEEEVGSERAGGLNSLPDGPKLAGPTRRQRRSFPDGERVRFAQRGGGLAANLSGAVCACIVYQIDVERPGRRLQ